MQNKADPSGLLTPGSAMEQTVGSKLPFAKDNVRQKEGVKIKCWNTNVHSAVGAEPQLSQQVKQTLF